MLATAYPDPPEDVIRRLARDDGNWVFEVKWDGVRCIAVVEDGRATLTNRNGTNITARYPDVAHELEQGFPSGSWAFDGEIVAFADDRPSFSLLQRRDRLTNPEKIAAVTRAIPVTYILFDCLMSEGADLRGHVLEARRIMLDNASAHTGNPILVNTQSQNPVLMWRFVVDNDLEGLVAKHRFRTYAAGRSNAWVKVKRVREGSFMVTGYEDGQGKHEGRVGALHLATDDGTDVGKVGTGFTDKEREELKRRIDAGDRLKVDVHYLEMTKDGSLRFPTFRGIRTA